MMASTASYPIVRSQQILSPKSSEKPYFETTMKSNGGDRNFTDDDALSDETKVEELHELSEVCAVSARIGDEQPNGEAQGNVENGLPEGNKQSKNEPKPSSTREYSAPFNPEKKEDFQYIFSADVAVNSPEQTETFNLIPSGRDISEKSSSHEPISPGVAPNFDSTKCAVKTNQFNASSDTSKSCNQHEFTAIPAEINDKQPDGETPSASCSKAAFELKNIQNDSETNGRFSDIPQQESEPEHTNGNTLKSVVNLPERAETEEIISENSGEMNILDKIDSPRAGHGISENSRLQSPVLPSDATNFEPTESEAPVIPGEVDNKQPNGETSPTANKELHNGLGSARADSVDVDRPIEEDALKHDVASTESDVQLSSTLESDPMTSEADTLLAADKLGDDEDPYVKNGVHSLEQAKTINQVQNEAESREVDFHAQDDEDVTEKSQPPGPLLPSVALSLDANESVSQNKAISLPESSEKPSYETVMESNGINRYSTNEESCNKMAVEKKDGLSGAPAVLDENDDDGKELNNSMSSAVLEQKHPPKRMNGENDITPVQASSTPESSTPIGDQSDFPILQHESTKFSAGAERMKDEPLEPLKEKSKCSSQKLYPTTVHKDPQPDKPINLVKVERPAPSNTDCSDGDPGMVAEMGSSVSPSCAISPESGRGSEHKNAAASLFPQREVATDAPDVIYLGKRKREGPSAFKLYKDVKRRREIPQIPNDVWLEFPTTPAEKHVPVVDKLDRMPSFVTDTFEKLRKLESTPFRFGYTHYDGLVSYHRPIASTESSVPGTSSQRHLLPEIEEKLTGFFTI
ncbi:unnamed protein product [Caenorhabditis sp. 36 PRJEB53466]|nr:unnamed protein product [Caenorhabditis sp. 36 PRJEB53466]